MTEQQNANTEPERKKKLFLPLIILIAAIAVITGGYLISNWVINKLDATTTQAEEAFVAVKQLQTKYDQLQNNLQELQNAVQKVNITKVKYWKPIVIEHLIRMADLTLNTTGDTKLALSFLLAANQYTSDLELSAINHALNRDIAALQTVPLVDASELILKIEAINQKIGVLPLIVSQFTSPQKEQIGVSEPAGKTLWQRLCISTVNALKDIVIIRHQVADPLLSPEQEIILRLDMQTKLLQVQLAIMHRQNKLYQSCLEQTINLITRYFAVNQEATIDILSSLQELQRVDLQPKFSFPTESIAAIINFSSANKLSDEKAPQPQITLQSEGAKPL